MKRILSDEEMIRQYLTSQPKVCFETLYNRYVGKVYKQCLSMTQDSEKAQDFTHDIFIKVFNNLDDFHQKSKLSTWIYTIAYNYCSDQIRLSKRLSLTTLDDKIEHQITESFDTLPQEETLLLVKQAIASLSSEEQIFLCLKYEEGLSIEELAEKYNLKISTVKMRLKRSRAKIQQFIDYVNSRDF